MDKSKEIKLWVLVLFVGTGAIIGYGEFVGWLLGSTEHASGD